MQLGWRWRRNPLRRRTDVIEAWLGLITAVLLCALPALGWWAGHEVDHGLRQVVRAEHAERTLVTATVQPASTQKTGSTPAPESGSAGPGGTDVLRWRGPDGSVHTAAVSAEVEVRHAGEVKVWTNHDGVLVPPPLDSATANTHAVLAGVASAAGAGCLLLISRKVLMWRLMNRRMVSWEREWARAGGDWGRTGAGG
ncbi:MULTISPECIES: Rv1733c family protein [unclassified Streptomyces]|uniref:Rv1733c family protein n=1 Tax=unclassified Streptomyces TaxID=2593676 RepID=UPI002E28D7F0|nr:hypothetical protein [Streptomyces sp. NBC_00223]